MSDFLTNMVMQLDPTLSADDVDMLKDDPQSGVRPLMSAMSQFARRNNPAALAQIGFKGMEGGVMTAIKFMPETDIIIQKAREVGGGIIVVDTSEEVWHQRLARRGLTPPSRRDAVERERPSVDSIVSRCKAAHIPVWHFNNNAELNDDPSNEAFKQLCEIVQQAHNLHTGIPATVSR